MIKDFACKETKKVWEGEFSKKLPEVIQGVARRKLRMLDEVWDLEGLRVLPGNHLERMEREKGREGEWSMRVNDQWRICFFWDEGEASGVRMEDYHHNHHHH